MSAIRKDRRHGLSRMPEYRAWQTMRLRCLNPHNAAYPSYGGRGITVCERWLESPANFLADMGLKPTPRHEIDRENNDGNYEPGNCRWVLRKVNDRNRRNNRFVELCDQKLTLAEWSERTGLPHSTLTKRLAAGWTVEQTLTIPLLRSGPQKVKPEASRSLAPQRLERRAA